MKKIQLIIYFLILVPFVAFSQENSRDVFEFDVLQNLPRIFVYENEIDQITTLLDLNPEFQIDWIKEVISVEVITIIEGKTYKNLGTSIDLTHEQKSSIRNADLDGKIEVKVLYMPENTLSHNDPQELTFTTVILPVEKAEYFGGKDQLLSYIYDNSIRKIQEGTYVDYDLSLIKFVINEEGEIENAHVFGSEYKESKHRDVESLLLNSICNMPKWNPAQFSTGLKIEQEFVLAVGNLENCSIHILNIQ